MESKISCLCLFVCLLVYKGIGKLAGLEWRAREEAANTSRSQTELQFGNENVLHTSTCTVNRGSTD